MVPCAHASAVKGVKFIHLNFFVSVGWDKRICLWRYDWLTLDCKLMFTTLVDVEDISSIDVNWNLECNFNQKIYASVCGQGLSLVEINLEENQF